MASTLTTRLDAMSKDVLARLSPLIHSRANLIITALSLPFIYLTWSDYQAWLAVGRGGLPHNPVGYLIAIIFRPLKASPFDTSFVMKPRILKKSGPAGEKVYLSEEDIPIRKGSRPEICGWILPQRQIKEKAGTRSRDRFVALITSLAAEHPDKLKVDTSALERSGSALFIKSTVDKHPGAFGTRNEIAHIHTSDGSMHLSISPKDAKMVIERGWGERFGLSGSLLPVTYTLIYAPRSGAEEDEEIKVVEAIIRAGTRFMLGQD